MFVTSENINFVYTSCLSQTIIVTNKCTFFKCFRFSMNLKVQFRSERKTGESVDDE